MTDKRVPTPNEWFPRPYQLKAWNALEEGCKRAVFVWHRRSGKDDVALHWTACEATETPGNYWYLLPQANQARKAIWDAVDPHTGRRRIDWVFPQELRETTREQDMLIRFKRTGSTWQVVGSDNYQALIGSPPIGIVYSEYMLSDPNSWSFIRPILLENNGWAIFNGTPRGRNHLHGLYMLGQEGEHREPGWFTQLLTVKDTGRFTPEEIEKERREIAAERGSDEEAENLIQQEYYCSWDAAIPGSYFGRLIAKLELEDCIGHVAYDPRYPVVTAWDIGVGDSTAIWFAQRTRTELRVLDYYENSGVGADHYAKIVRAKPYAYDYHILPPDAGVREWGNNARDRVSVLKELGIQPIRLLGQAAHADGINAGRIILHGARFDRKKCERGLNALRQHQRRWDDKLKVFSETPLHDWTSHAAAAWRYLGQGLKDQPGGSRSRPAMTLT